MLVGAAALGIFSDDLEPAPALEPFGACRFDTLAAGSGTGAIECLGHGGEVDPRDRCTFQRQALESLPMVAGEDECRRRSRARLSIPELKSIAVISTSLG